MCIVRSKICTLQVVADTPSGATAHPMCLKALELLPNNIVTKL
jgi:hypothetical protein